MKQPINQPAIQTSNQPANRRAIQSSNQSNKYQIKQPSKPNNQTTSDDAMGVEETVTMFFSPFFGRCQHFFMFDDIGHDNV